METDQSANPPKQNNEQVILAIEKYISLIVIEFKEHIQKYNSLFTNMCTNTHEHFDTFQAIINDYSEEIKSNQGALYEMLSKFNVINEELPKLEELYYKVKEMRTGLEKLYREYSAKINSKTV